MTFNRRQFFKGAAALTALSALPAFVQTAAAQTNAPTVSEADAYNLFSEAVNAVDGGLVDHRSYNLQSEMQTYYSNKQDDRYKALAIAFVAMGGLTLADQAGREAVGHYRQIYEPVTRQDEYLRDNSVKKQIVDEYASKLYVYGGKKMSFTQQTAVIASDLLDSAYNKHKMNFTDYMTQIYMPFKTINKSDLAIKSAASFIGLGNTTVAMASVRQP